MNSIAHLRKPSQMEQRFQFHLAVSIVNWCVPFVWTCSKIQWRPKRWVKMFNWLIKENWASTKCHVGLFTCKVHWTWACHNFLDVDYGMLICVEVKLKLLNVCHWKNNKEGFCLDGSVIAVRSWIYICNDKIMIYFKSRTCMHIPTYI